MKQIFLLSKENLEFSKQEVLALTNPDSFELNDNLLILNADLDLSKRLAFTHSIYKFLFRCKKEELVNKIKSFDWQSVYKTDFCIRVYGGSKLFEKECAAIIWDKLQKPSVNLVNSSTEINFFFRDEDVICGVKLSDVDKSFFDRWPHKRPAFHPTSITSKLARAAVNMAGLRDGFIWDPFCGSGAILIEAGLMGFNVIGSDLDDKILRMSKTNLDFYGVKDYYLKVLDATDLPSDVKFDAIVCDPPYGRNVKVKGDLSDVYSCFLKSAYNMMKEGSKLVVICPKSLNVLKLNKLFALVSVNDWFIHNSLTRQVVVLVKQ